jgi:hypothetical protein
MCDGPASCSALIAGSRRHVGSQTSTNPEWDGMREQPCFPDAGGACPPAAPAGSGPGPRSDPAAEPRSMFGEEFTLRQCHGDEVRGWRASEASRSSIHGIRSDRARERRAPLDKAGI